MSENIKALFGILYTQIYTTRGTIIRTQYNCDRSSHVGGDAGLRKDLVV